MLLVRTLKCTAQLQVSWSASLVFQIKAHCASILCDVSCQRVYLLYLFRSNFKKNQPNKTCCTEQLFGTMAWGQQVYPWVGSSLTCKQVSALSQTGVGQQGTWQDLSPHKLHEGNYLEAVSLPSCFHPWPELLLLKWQKRFLSMFHLGALRWKWTVESSSIL